MSYPTVMSEDATIDLAQTRSLSRFGDGELRLAVGGSAISQRPDTRLRRELIDILGKPQEAVVCIPNVVRASPKHVNWLRYAEPRYASLYKQAVYGSSFVTRADSAPWIARPSYWDKVRALWRGLDIIMVTGEPMSSPKMQGVGAGAASVQFIAAPRQHAYAEIDRIEEEIGMTTKRVVLCVGATATVLAARLARKDIHALDLGHIGMFMERNATTKPEDLMAKEEKPKPQDKPKPAPTPVTDHLPYQKG